MIKARPVKDDIKFYKKCPSHLVLGWLLMLQIESSGFIESWVPIVAFWMHFLQSHKTGIWYVWVHDTLIASSFHS